VVVFCTLGLIGGVSAQTTRGSLYAGRMNYDAGGDRSRSMVRISADRRVGSSLRLGIGAAWVDVGKYVGDPDLLVVPADSGDEKLWRVFATLNLSAETAFRGSDVPVINRLAPWAEVGVGVVHSAGRARVAVPSDNPFYAPVDDTRTGPSLGAGVGLDATITRNLGLRAGMVIWQDLIYGSSLSDLDQFLGFTVGF
jgi:hypothetical protein